MGTKRPTTDEADRHLLADIAGAKADDGGPAFPTTTFQRVGELEEGVSSGGMTLRDHFAGQALAGILAAPHTRVGFRDKKANTAWPSCTSEFRVAVVKAVYAYADLMLAARNPTT